MYNLKREKQTQYKVHADLRPSKQNHENIGVNRNEKLYNLVVPSKRGGGSEVGDTVGGRISCTPLGYTTQVTTLEKNESIQIDSNSSELGIFKKILTQLPLI